MSRLTATASFIRKIKMIRAQNLRCSYFSTVIPNNNAYKNTPNSTPSTGDRVKHSEYSGKDSGTMYNRHIGQNVPRKYKVNFLLQTLIDDLNDSKEGVYGALDAWVVWEQKFPIESIKIVIKKLETDHQWHRVVQVIKWMLSKGQGATMGTYGQLIRALDMDHRAEEAHEIWEKKVGHDLHSVPWDLCASMIAVYYRNNMLERLIKLFKGLEAFDRKPHDKAVVRRVADTYELLGLPEEKDKLMEKYNDLFTVKQPKSNPSKLKMQKEHLSDRRKKNQRLPPPKDENIEESNSHV